MTSFTIHAPQNFLLWRSDVRQWDRRDKWDEKYMKMFYQKPWKYNLRDVGVRGRKIWNGVEGKDWIQQAQEGIKLQGLVDAINSIKRGKLTYRLKVYQFFKRTSVP